MVFEIKVFGHPLMLDRVSMIFSQGLYVLTSVKGTKMFPATNLSVSLSMIGALYLCVLAILALPTFGTGLKCRDNFCVGTLDEIYAAPTDRNLTYYVKPDAVEINCSSTIDCLGRSSECSDGYSTIYSTLYLKKSSTTNVKLTIRPYCKNLQQVLLRELLLPLQHSLETPACALFKISRDNLEILDFEVNNTNCVITFRKVFKQRNTFHSGLFWVTSETAISGLQIKQIGIQSFDSYGAYVSPSPHSGHLVLNDTCMNFMTRTVIKCDYVSGTIYLNNVTHVEFIGNANLLNITGLYNTTTIFNVDSFFTPSLTYNILQYSLSIEQESNIPKVLYSLIICTVLGVLSEALYLILSNYHKRQVTRVKHS